MPSLTQPWATLIAGAAVLISALIAAGVGVYNRRQAERHFQKTHDRESVGALRGRYTTAAEQLAHDSAAIRLAGVYAIVALADDWHLHGSDDERQVCIDLLLAYLRTPQRSPDITLDSGYSPDKGSFESWSREREEWSLAEDREREVRRTIVAVLNRRRRLEVANAKSWAATDCSFASTDLSRLEMDGMNFAGAKLSHARLDKATLRSACFAGATLTSASLRGANMADANLKGASLHSTMLDRADLSGANFADAHMLLTFMREAILSDADFRGAAMRLVNVQGASYNDKTQWAEGFSPDGAVNDPYAAL